MKSKLFEITLKQFYELFTQDDYIKYDYIEDEIFQVYFYDKLYNHIATHFYKIVEEKKQ